MYTMPSHAFCCRRHYTNTMKMVYHVMLWNLHPVGPMQNLNKMKEVSRTQLRKASWRIGPLFLQLLFIVFSHFMISLTSRYKYLYPSLIIYMSCFIMISTNLSYFIYIESFSLLRAFFFFFNVDTISRHII